MTFLPSNTPVQSLSLKIVSNLFPFYFCFWYLYDKIKIILIKYHIIMKECIKYHIIMKECVIFLILFLGGSG